MMKPNLRCSSLPIVWNCQAPFVLPAEFTVDHVGGVAGVGTAGHRIAEAMVNTGIVPDDAWVQALADELNVGYDDISPLRWYMRRIWAEIGPAFPQPTTELEMSADLGFAQLQGHADLVSVRELPDGLAGSVLDWKFGYRTEVNVEPQLRGYAYLTALLYDLERVQAVVVWVRDKSLVTWEWTRSELTNWFAELGQRVADWNGNYTLGDHCRYCPRFYRCPAQQEQTRGTIECLGGALAFENISPELVGEMYPRVKDIERLCGEFVQSARQIIERDGFLPLPDGKALVFIPKTRETILPEESWPTLAEELDAGELASCVTVGKGKLEKAIAKHAGKGYGAAAIRRVMGHLRNIGAIVSKPIAQN